MKQSSDPRVLSIQVGLPREQGGEDSPYTTAFYKEPVTGPVQFGRFNIQGDGQADLLNHGGVDKAVLAYSADHYPVWENELGERLPYGAFGENLTIANLTEVDVCIGDVWQFSNVKLEVSQPRQPCWKLARRWNRPDLPKRIVKTGRSGWYLRVREEGAASVGKLILVVRPNPKWTIARANLIFYGGSEKLAMEELAGLPQLSPAWRDDLSAKLR